jgi:hypothetical protein
VTNVRIANAGRVDGTGGVIPGGSGAGCAHRTAEAAAARCADRSAKTAVA